MKLTKLLHFQVIVNFDMNALSVKNSNVLFCKDILEGEKGWNRGRDIIRIFD